MSDGAEVAKLLGATQLFVFVASIGSEHLLASVTGSISSSERLVNISKNLSRIRLSNLVALLNSLAIVVLTVLFYKVFRSQYEIIALTALGFFLAEAITLAASKIGALALVPLSENYIEAHAPEQSHLEPLAHFLFEGVDKQGYLIHNLFFCLGAVLWYYLFLISGYIPLLLSLWDLAAVCLLTIAVFSALYDRKSTPLMIFAFPYLPYELFLGAWLIVIGFA